MRGGSSPKRRGSFSTMKAGGSFTKKAWLFFHEERPTRRLELSWWPSMEVWFRVWRWTTDGWVWKSTWLPSEGRYPTFLWNDGNQRISWLVEQLANLFEIMEVMESNQVKRVAIQLKGTDNVCWDMLVTQRRVHHKGLVQTWRRMYIMYINCHQRRGVKKYTMEFLRLCEHSELKKTKGQKMAR